MKKNLILILFISSISFSVAQSKYSLGLNAGLFGPSNFGVEAALYKTAGDNMDYFLSVYYLRETKGASYGDSNSRQSLSSPATTIPVDLGFKYYFIDRKLSPYFVGETGLIFRKEDEFNIKIIPVPSENRFIYNASIESVPLKVYWGIRVGAGVTVQISERLNLDLVSKIQFLFNGNFKSDNLFLGGGFSYGI
ncbi:MAG: hypothetical protein AB1775_07335 [Bacteroidota bacterium]